MCVWLCSSGLRTFLRLPNTDHVAPSQSTGLAAKGYRYLNVDEGWLASRDPITMEMQENRTKFPSGMR
jgi:hypothetical protein